MQVYRRRQINASVSAIMVWGSVFVYKIIKSENAFRWEYIYIY